MEADIWYHNPEIWVAVSFALFMLLAWRYILPVICKALDDRAGEIRGQLEQASRLRAEAAALLAQYQQEHDEKVREAGQLVAQARTDAQAMRTQAAADLKAAIDRRTKQAEEKIHRAEVEAVSEIRTRMIEIATQAAHEIIEAQLQTAKEDPAVLRALSAIEQQIH